MKGKIQGLFGVFGPALVMQSERKEIYHVNQDYVNYNFCTCGGSLQRIFSYALFNEDIDQEWAIPVLFFQELPYVGLEIELLKQLQNSKFVGSSSSIIGFSLART